MFTNRAARVKAAYDEKNTKYQFETVLVYFTWGEFGNTPWQTRAAVVVYFIRNVCGNTAPKYQAVNRRNSGHTRHFGNTVRCEAIFFRIIHF